MMARRLRALLPLFLLSACGGMSARLDQKIDETDGKMTTLLRDTGHTATGIVPKAPGAVSHDSGIWLGKELRWSWPTSTPLVDQPWRSKFRAAVWQPICGNPPPAASLSTAPHGSLAGSISS